MCVLDIELPFSSLHLPRLSPSTGSTAALPRTKPELQETLNLFFQVGWRWERAAGPRCERLSRINTGVLGCSSCPSVLWQAGLPSLVLLEVEVLESWEKWGKQQRFEVKQAAPVQPQPFLCFGFLIFWISAAGLQCLEVLLAFGLK